MNEHQMTLRISADPRIGYCFVKKFYRCKICRRKILNGKEDLRVIMWMKDHDHVCSDCYKRVKK